MPEKRKRSVSASLYPTNNENKKQKHIIEAIKNKNKTTHALVKKLSPRLIRSFDDYLSLFSILDVNRDHVVSRDEWLRFSLGNSYLHGNRRKRKRRRKRRAKRSKSSRKNSKSKEKDTTKTDKAAPKLLKRKRSKSALNEMRPLSMKGRMSIQSAMLPRLHLQSAVEITEPMSSPRTARRTPPTPRRSIPSVPSHDVAPMLSTPQTPNYHIGSRATNSSLSPKSPSPRFPEHGKQSRPSFRTSTSMKIFCKYDIELDTLEEEKETSGGSGASAGDKTDNDSRVNSRRSFLSSVHKARSSYDKQHGIGIGIGMDSLNSSMNGSNGMNGMNGNGQNRSKTARISKPLSMMAVGKSFEIMERANKQKKEKPRIRRRIRRTRVKSVEEAMTMREMMEAEFDQIDLDGNGVIDKFEFCVFFMTHDLGVQWTPQQTKYRMNLYNNLLKTVGRKPFTTEWLESRILASKHQSKLYSLWEFISEYFAGEVKHVSLLGKKRVSSVEVLTWFIALNFDPLANIKEVVSKLPHCPSLTGSHQTSRPTSGRPGKRTSRGPRESKEMQRKKAEEAKMRAARLSQIPDSARRSTNFPRKSIANMQNLMMLPKAEGGYRSGTNSANRSRNRSKSGL